MKTHLRAALTFFFLISLGGCLFASKNKRLLAAVNKGDAREVKSLLEKGADANAIGIVELRLEGLPRDYWRLNRTALTVAIVKNRADIVKMLIEKGANVDLGDTPVSDPPLQLAVNRHHTDIVKMLIEKGARVNIGSGTSILSDVVQGGQIDLVKMLLDKGADPNIKDNVYCVPLSQAAYRAAGESDAGTYTSIAKALLAHGADAGAAIACLEKQISDQKQGAGVTPVGGLDYFVREHRKAQQMLRDLSGKQAEKQAEEKIKPLEQAGDEAARSGDSGKAISQYVAALQEVPRGSDVDQRLREKIIQYALSLDPPPAVPEEAQRLEVQGQALLEKAQSREDYQAPFAKLQKAVDLAPWWADGYYNLGLLQEKMEDYGGAIESLNYYLLANPQAQDAGEVQTKIYKLEALKEQAEK